MRFRNRVRTVFALCAFASVGLTAAPTSADLRSYVDKPEPVFEWQLKNKIDREQSGDRIYDLQFVSQVWQGKKWQHQLQIYRPADAAPGATMFLWVTGGAAVPETISLGLELARKIKAPVAFLYHIPNQPLLEGNLREDDLIAETFVRYLKSGDESWPLLLPMVKGVVKAMDVLQAFGKKEWNMGQHASDTRALTFTDVKVPGSNLLGKEGDGFKIAMTAFDHTRPIVSAAAVGLARCAMEHSIRYAQERRSFGVPIASHQAVSFMIAEMAMNIEAARLLVWQCAGTIDRGERNTRQAAMAKAFAADMAMKTALDAVQVFGGYGFSSEYPVEKLMRDAKVFQIYEGTSQIQRLIIAKEIFDRK